MKIVTTAENRKDVVKAMEEIMGVKAKYQGPPTFNYQIGNCTVDKEGNVECETEEQKNDLTSQLTEKGVIGETDTEVNIDIPLEGHTAESLKNLVFMIHSKQYLIEKSVGRVALRMPEKLVERLQNTETQSRAEMIQIIMTEEPYGLTFSEERIRFNKFPLEPAKQTAYCTLLAMMCSSAKGQTRVLPTETKEENEKYYMRAWLVRIGLGGKGGKETRKILLSNLKGHSAFRTEADKEKWIAKNGKKKAESSEE